MNCAYFVAAKGFASSSTTKDPDQTPQAYLRPLLLLQFVFSSLMRTTPATVLQADAWPAPMPLQDVPTCRLQQWFFL
jgi:hypothetical protein